LQAPRPDAFTDRRIERVLAEARVFVAVASFLTIFLDRTGPGPQAATYQLLVAYLSLSIALLLTTSRRPPTAHWLPLAMHALDVAWLIALTTLTASDRPLFAFFTFVLLAATYRWGARETLVTLAVVTVALLVKTVAFGGPPNGLVDGTFGVTGFAGGAAYLLITGVVLAHLANEERELRIEVAASAECLAAARAETRLRTTFDKILRVLAQLFGSQHVVVVLRQTNTDVAYMWQLSGPRETAQVTGSTLTAGEAAAYLWTAPPAFLMVRAGRQNRFTFVIDSDRLFRRGSHEGTPLDLPGFERSRRILAASASISSPTEEWVGRVMVGDPSMQRRENALRLLQRLVQQLAPALYNRYLVGRIRTRAGALERARLARDLHDSSIQALIGLEMHLLALSRRVNELTIRDELIQAQSRLRVEIRGLRTLMDQLHPKDQGPGNIGQYLVTLADQFGQDTKIRTRVTCPPGLAVPPDLAYEIGRIAQAALSNVRRHSSATRVDIRIERRDDSFLLEIEDDGTGLEVQRRLFRGAPIAEAPRTIRERVHGAGGELVVRSLPTGGTCLEISIPATMVSL
jgi:signal transduction histidine kinase